MSLADRFEVRRRFQRSVNLGLDAPRADACDGYLSPPSVAPRCCASSMRSLLVASRARGRSPDHTAQANPRRGVPVASVPLCCTPVEVLALLRASDPEGGAVAEALERVRRGARGFTTVLITATYGPLVPSLLDAIERAVQGRHGARNERLVREVHALRVARGRSVELHRRIVSLVAELAALTCDAHGGGLVIVFDELGKTLEHAARGTTRTDDVFLLQELAELAARSGQAPVLLVTLSIRRSTATPSRSARRPARSGPRCRGVSKDVAFLDMPAEMLRLAAQSIRRRANHDP